VPLDDGLALLKMVKDHGYKVFALSNLTHGAYQKIVAYKNDFFELFDGAIFSYKVQAVKPEPMIYQIILQEYNLNPDQCFFIDDVDMNVTAAKALGIDGMVYRNAEQALQDMILLQILPHCFLTSSFPLSLR
jgi:FMN phosphatase YigB (HAD superfamily)